MNCDTKNNKSVLVTGCAGYIGSILSENLLEKGYRIIGVDALLFGKDSLKKCFTYNNFSFNKIDLRDKNSILPLLNRVDVIVNLAAIVGEPACNKNPDLAYQTNWVASKNLFDTAVAIKSVKRFITASTCSNYGKKQNDEFLDETSELRPISLYSELKVRFEKYVLSSETRKDFVPTALRFATAYGCSPRMRFDLTINEFARDIALGRKLSIYGENFWRPYCYVRDLANACIMAIEAPASIVDHQVFNVGDSRENYTKKQLSEMLKKIDSNAQIQFVKMEEDLRDYRVNFEKIKKELSFKPTKDVFTGFQDVYSAVKNNLYQNPFSQFHRNI